MVDSPVMSKVGAWASVQYGAKAKFSRAASGGWSAAAAEAGAGAPVAAGRTAAPDAPELLEHGVARVVRPVGRAVLPAPSARAGRRLAGRAAPGGRGPAGRPNRPGR